MGAVTTPNAMRAEYGLPEMPSSTIFEHPGLLHTEVQVPYDEVMKFLRSPPDYRHPNDWLRGFMLRSSGVPFWLEVIDYITREPVVLPWDNIIRIRPGRAF